MQEILRHTALFDGLSAEEITAVVSDVGGVVRRYEAGESLWCQGEQVSSLGVVLSGAVEAVAYSREGDAELVAHHGPGQVVGDVLMASCSASPVTLESRSATEMLFLPLSGLYPEVGEVPLPLRKVQRNLLRETGEKFWQQRRRIAYLVQPRLRERVMMYLQHLSPAQGVWFTVPLDRQGMAQFLGAERSALSRVLSQLRAEGLIEYRKSDFCVKSG